MIRKLSFICIVMLLASVAVSPTSAASRNYSAHLSGDQEVLPVETQAQGQATFKVAKDGESIEYRLIVANIENVVAAHIHLAPAGQNGSVVVTLYGGVPAGGGRISGPIATGVLTGDDLVGPLAGQDFSVLIAEINAGNTYVNVHTNDGVGDTNTGPGDFPGGEIRGQI